ncbi:MAG: hypothetical protein AAGD34_14555, partial [Pseudomonadota bacterium]
MSAYRQPLTIQSDGVCTTERTPVGPTVSARFDGPSQTVDGQFYVSEAPRGPMVKSGKTLNEELVAFLAADFERCGYRRSKYGAFEFLKDTEFGTKGILFSESMWPNGVNYITNFGIHDVELARYKY